MANFLSGNWRGRIVDLFWPILTGDENKPEDVVCLDAENTGLLTEVEVVADKRITEYDERYKQVTGKLLALLTLTTVFSAVITAGVVAVAMMSVTKPDKVIATVAIPLVAYILLLLARTLIATVNGLTRRGFSQLGVEDIVPGKTESAEEYRLRILNKRVDYLFKNELVVNEMVSEMAVAHVAMRNALIASAILVISAVGLAVWQLFAG